MVFLTLACARPGVYVSPVFTCNKSASEMHEYLSECVKHIIGKYSK